MADNSTADHQIGDFITWRIEPGIVVASYFVSLIGSITTVELLHRHQTGKGWRSWIQQGAIAVSFGLVAIWCMHFVGNRAIVMGDGDETIQLYYNPGFTALSAFLPIIFLFLGLTTVELRQPGQRFFWPMLVLSGICAGLAITGMHYVGNFGIRNYSVDNPVGFIIGAAAIAITASVTALSLFFFFKEKWINSLWRRVLCACLLACAVSGMHWVATAGTKYQLKGLQSQGVNRNTNLIVALVLSMLACVACLTIALLTRRRRKQLADRAQHVVLVSVTFDDEGRILVTNEGLMPTQRITKQYNQRSFNDEFNVAHPVFQWLFRVSCNWAGIADLLPAMKAHLRATGGLKDATRSTTPDTRSSSYDSQSENTYSMLFREQFCVAAADLAELLQTSVTNVGILYDGIMTTGTSGMGQQSKFRRPMSSTLNKAVQDLERADRPGNVFGKGQALFVVRSVGKAEGQNLIGAGYRFATLDQVGNMIAQAMQVHPQELASAIGNMKEYSSKEDNLPTSGTFLACYCLRPAVNSSLGHWDILVPKEYAFRLPKVELLPDNLKAWQVKFLSRMDGFSTTQCINWLSTRVDDPETVEEGVFIELLLSRIAALSELVSEPFFKQAVFTAQAIDAQPNHTCILAFCIIPDVHVASLKSSHKLVYTPYNFFRCRQRVYKNSPDHAILARNVHREFGALLASSHTNSDITSRKDSIAGESNSPGARRKFWKFNRLSASNAQSRDSLTLHTHSDTASERGLVTHQKEMNESSVSHPFGGIMVSQDITIDANAKDEANFEMRNIGPKIEAGVKTQEQPTFVDELFRITVNRWHRA